MRKDIPEYRKYLIERLGFIRNRAKLSARELSQRLGKSIAYIAKFENGDFNMSSEMLLDAIEICGSTPEEFFSRNVNDYQNVKEFIDVFEKLNPESQQTIKDLMKNMK